MNYLKVYCNLIRKAENRTLPNGYTEKHHTFPKSIFGNNCRIVVLTAREHYIAHALLEKICIKRYGIKHWKTIKMSHAHHCMSLNKNTGQRYFNSLLFENLKYRLSEIQKNKVFSEETKEKMRKSKLGNKAWLNKKHKEESKQKVSKARKGKCLSKEHIEKLKVSHSKITYKIVSPNGKEFILKNLTDFCKENDLNVTSMRNTFLKNKTYKGGWYATIIER
jgi:hypothetical protein